jgi:hypothetical protein
MNSSDVASWLIPAARNPIQVYGQSLVVIFFDICWGFQFKTWCLFLTPFFFSTTLTVDIKAKTHTRSSFPSLSHTHTNTHETNGFVSRRQRSEFNCLQVCGCFCSDVPEYIARGWWWSGWMRTHHVQTGDDDCRQQQIIQHIKRPSKDPGPFDMYRRNRKQNKKDIHHFALASWYSGHIFFFLNY